MSIIENEHLEALYGGQVGASTEHFFERTSVVTITNLSFSEWATVIGDPYITTASIDRLTNRCHILDTESDSFGFKTGTAAATRKAKEDTDAVTQV